ncbi:MAG: tetratricopeptide repeat protein [Chloroflexi bacterium]|nr:tetratricopeptide repeat protein [Chloroflexota bacterium]
MAVASRGRGEVPAPLTPFVGRGAQIETVMRLLNDGRRLVTLTGPAGVGKTRLAIAVAAGAAAVFPDGARFVSLAPISDAQLVPGLIAAVLDIADATGTDLIAATAAAMGTRRVLLVLDNFEHVLAAGQVIPELLAGCPGLAVLATSRTPLRLSSEYLLPVPTLSVPDRHHAYAREEIEQYDAVQLFLSRARAACGEFALTDGNTASVIDICSKLNGLPLAIELAAARLRMLAPEALLERMQPGLPLLSSSAQDVPTRLRTMRDAVAWSYDLLSPDQQVLLRRLSVFAGGFSLTAAEHVCLDDMPGTDALEALSALFDHSLIRRSDQDGADPRFEMLYVVREFALEQLIRAGEEAPVRRAHARYFRRLADQAALARGADQERMHALIALEMNNIRAVLAWALRDSRETEDPRRGLAAAWEPQDLDDALDLCGTLWFFWLHYSTTPGEARLWLTRALEVAPVRVSVARARALLGLGALEWRQGDYAPAHLHLDESAALFTQLDDLRGLADAFHLVGHVLFEGRDHAGARVFYERSLDAHTRLNDPVGGVPLVGDLGMVGYHTGDYASARRQFEACLRLCREHGVRDHEADSFNRLGDLARLEGDLDAAQRLYSESLSLWRNVHGLPGIASCLHKLGQTARARGDFAEGRRLILESLNIQRDISNKQGLLECLLALAGLAVETAPPEQVAELFGASEAAYEALGAPIAPADLADSEHDRARAAAALPERTWRVARERGRGRSLVEALALAESLADTPRTDETAGRTDVPSKLSPREVEVVRLLARGLSNRAIAANLTISEKTASNHVEHIMTKLDLRSRAQVAVWAVRHGVSTQQ